MRVIPKIAAAFLIIIALAPAAASTTTDTVFLLTQTSIPLAARQEKGRGLLQSWDYVAPGFIEQFRLNGEDDLVKIQSALDTVLDRHASYTTGTAITPAAEHYLVWATARAQMVNQLDFSEASLRHFFELNAAHYPCEPRATVSELLIPRTYTDAAQTTAILDDIAARLKKESFPRVAYHINDQLGHKGTGYRGEVTQAEVGMQRFSLYTEVAKNGNTVGGSGDPVGGPFSTPDGLLYVQVHKIVAGPADCYTAYKDQIAQDYGREWLKKIQMDTLTTAARELRPEIHTYTTGTLTSAPAFTVDGHTLTFKQARAALPFLMGNQADPRFWQSIQRQAIEVELIYHSQTGKDIRALPQFAAMQGTMQYLADANKRLKQQLATPPTTAVLTAWFDQNQYRYTKIGEVSYAIYDCETSPGSSLTPEDHARCAAALEALRHPSNSEAEERQNPLATHTDIGVTITNDTTTSASFEAQSREIQVAIQNLKAGEWSQVFTENGRPRVLHLIAIQKHQPAFQDIQQQILSDYILDFQMTYWQNIIAH